MLKIMRIAIGVLLLWGALGVLGYRLGWDAHAHQGQRALVSSVKSHLVTSRACTPGSASSGELAGLLEIPALGVTAPVEQGTSNAVLDVAVGHFASTPWPGYGGTSALLAHDVSYFARIDQLRQGDQIRFEWPCATDVFTVTAHAVVKAGSALPQVPGESMVLDTCWPTNALWFTPDRYLVEAVESSVVATAKGPAAAGGAGHGVPTRSGPGATGLPNWPTSFTTTAPPALAAQGLTLVDNEAPMGTMRVAGSPDPAWVQSPAPLGLEAAALTAYFGGLHAAAQSEQAWWSAIAPGVAMPPTLAGAWVSAHDSPLDVTITASGDMPVSVQLDTTVTLAGGSAPGRYSEQVTEIVHGTTLTITRWEVGNG
ncbi:MAG: class D sortase [Acidimicrobiales bacterium]